MSRSRLAADKPAPAPDPRAPLRWRRHYMDASALVAWSPPYSVERWGKRFRLMLSEHGRPWVLGMFNRLSEAKAAADVHRRQQQETTI